MMAGLKCVIALTVSFMIMSTPVQAFPRGFPRHPDDATSQTLQIFSKIPFIVMFVHGHMYMFMFIIIGGCIAAGHTNGCCQGSLNHCSVFTSNGICYCDEGCHSVSGGCCPDISDIGCVGIIIIMCGYMFILIIIVFYFTIQPLHVLMLGCLQAAVLATVASVMAVTVTEYADFLEIVAKMYPKVLTAHLKVSESQSHVDIYSPFENTVLASQDQLQEETRPIQVYSMVCKIELATHVLD